MFGRQCSPAPHSILQLFEYLEDSAPQHPTPSSSSDILFAPLQQSSQVLGGEPSLLSKSVIRGTRCVNLTGGWRKKKLFGKVDQSGFPFLFFKALCFSTLGLRFCPVVKHPAGLDPSSLLTFGEQRKITPVLTYFHKMKKMCLCESGGGGKGGVERMDLIFMS